MVKYAGPSDMNGDPLTENAAVRERDPMGGEPSGWTGIVVGFDDSGYPVVCWTGAPVDIDSPGRPTQGWDPEHLELIQPDPGPTVTVTPRTRLAVRLLFVGGGEVILPCPANTVRPQSIGADPRNWLLKFIDGHPDVIVWNVEHLAHVGFIEVPA